MSFGRALRTRKDAPGAGQRHPQPGWPMREFVFDLVERLLQQEEIEQTTRRLHGLRPEPRIAQRLPVSSEKRGDGQLTPAIERARDFPIFIGGRFECTLERSDCGIID